MSHESWFAAVALGAVVFAGAPVRDAEAKKKPKQSMSAKVDGKPIKGKVVVVAYHPGDSTGLSSGSGPKPFRVGGLIRTLEFLCAVDVKTLTPPVTLTQGAGGCGGEYDETKLGSPGRKAWLSSSFSVTFTSIAGLRVKGTFEGTVDPTPDHAADPSHTIQKGKFSIVLPGSGA